MMQQRKHFEFCLDPREFIIGQRIFGNKKDLETYPSPRPSSSPEIEKSFQNIPFHLLRMGLSPLLPNKINKATTT